MRLPLVALACLLIAAPADAAVTCSFNAGAKTLSVTASAVGDATAIHRAEGGTQIEVSSYAGGVVACSGGTATTTTIDSISYTDMSAGKTTLVVAVDNGFLGPGATSEAQFSTSEIEVSAAMGSGDDQLWLGGSTGKESWRLGSTAAGQVSVNLQTAELAPDADVTATGVEIVYANTLGDDDTIGGQGGLGTGGALDVPAAILFGDEGADSVTGGAQAETLGGGAGDDTLLGDGGDDKLDGGAGDDVVDGQAGSDTAAFGNDDSPVTVDLALTGAQPTGGQGTDTFTSIERLEGGDGADVLRGDDGVNFISGGKGDDVIEGRGSTDALGGGDGIDTLSYESAPAGVTVTLGGLVDGGAGSDDNDHFENLRGSEFDDVLTGDAGANRIEGGAGADTLSGLAGADEVLIRDGTADTADCGDGAADSVVADVSGLDVLTGCELTDFAPSPVTPAPDPQPGPAAGDPAPQPSATPAPAVCRKPGRYTLWAPAGLRRARATLDGRRVRVRRGRVRIALTKPGVHRVRFTGRTAKGRRVSRTRRLTVCG
jgi:Ca2+-binding RTX toxin-like protein